MESQEFITIPKIVRAVGRQTSGETSGAYILVREHGESRSLTTPQFEI